MGLMVADNGVGLPNDEWETIFEPYYRSHQRPGQPDSVGIGLTVARQLARRMGGDLAYRVEGGHSLFELTLPAVPSPPLPPQSTVVVGAYVVG